MVNESVMISLMIAASRLSGLPAVPVEQMAAIKSISQEEIVSMQCAEAPDECSGMVAFFDIPKNTIYLKNTLDLESTRDLSFLLHEMVHVLQYRALGEYIFSDGGLYKILGKKHYEGGTPLAAKGGEFIFSAHRDMSLDPTLQKEAGLKTAPSKALAEHVPAKVLERNVNVKEYNRLKTIVNNPKSDPVTKKTAEFMLEKMDMKIKTIADLQEAKKQPKPVKIEDQYLEQSEVEKDINEQKQYAYGGLTRYQDAGGVTKKTQEEVNNDVILKQIDEKINSIEDPKLQDKARILMLQNLNYSPAVRYKTLQMYINEGGSPFIKGQNFNPFRRDGDPRAEADVEKLVPFWGEDANGFWDWVGTLANSGVIFSFLIKVSHTSELVEFTVK